MEPLISKLSQLTYEIFGVLLPGAFGVLLLLVFWYGLGTLPPHLTHSTLPALSYDVLLSWRKSTEVLLGPAGPLGVACIAAYFVGHALDEMGRDRKTKKTGEARNPQPSAAYGLAEYGWSLILRIPRPLSNFDDRLQPLFEKCRSKLFPEIDTNQVPWTAFFPVARQLVWGGGRYSLITLFQNKYTLHRSVASAGSLLVFLSLLSALLSGIYGDAVDVRWWLIIGLGLFGLLLVRRFSQSYRDHWLSFGNAVVTEAYAALYTGDRHEDSGNMGRSGSRDNRDQSAKA